MASNKITIEIDPEAKEVLERFTKAALAFTDAIIAAGDAIRQLRSAAEKSAQQGGLSRPVDAAEDDKHSSPAA